MELQPNEDFILNFYIQLVEQLARIEDQHSQRRVSLELFLGGEAS